MELSKSVLTHFGEMRKFVLVRTEDVSGVSGTGVVAEGLEFSNGTCAITWMTPYRCIATYESIKALEHVHGHAGATVVIFEDELATTNLKPIDNPPEKG